MSVADLIDVGTDLWGGYCPAIPPSQLPQGASPNCQDVIFPEACVRSRPRLSSFFPSLGGNPTVNGLKTYANALANIMLAWDSLGNLYQEATPGNLTLIQGGGVPNLFMNSTSLFGREYIAFGDAKGGEDIPRQFDGTNYDRVSQAGPGAAPNATDETTAVATTGETQPAAVAIAAGPVGAVESGFLVTITTTAPHGLVAGQNVVVAGVGVVGYNNGGTNPAFFKVIAVPSGTTFTYVLGTSGLAASGGGTSSSCIATYTTATAHGLVVGQLVTTAGIAPGGYNVAAQPVFGVTSPTVFTLNLTVAGLGAGGAGTVTNVGSIAGGLRQVTVAFITRQGFITCPAVPNSWTAAGGKRVVLTNIPIGPSNIVARLLLFTTVITLPATTGIFFSLPTGSPSIATSVMQISDNTTTSVTVDFLDSILAAGFNGEYLFAQVELGECASVNSYNSRTVWLGERNKVKADGGGGGLINLGFDGGWSLPIASGTNTPLGWTNSPFATNRGVSAAGFGLPIYWGDAFVSVGGGAPISSFITQQAFQDYLGNPILSPGVGYSVRVRIARNSVLVSGRVNINLQSTIGGFTTTGLIVPVAQVGLTYQEFTAVILTPQATIPSDITLQLFTDGTPTNSGFFFIDCIEIFPTKAPFNTSIARISHANNPESFDGLLDVVQIAAPGANASVQSLRASWQIRTNLYLAKDHYLCYTTDDGQNEPASWPITEISNTIGCCGPNAWDGTEEWVVFCERSGQYLTTGSDPIKIVQEIQEDVSGTGKPNWNATNWLAAYTIWTRIDRNNKRILTGLPLNGAVSPNLIFQMDYKFSPTGDAIGGAQAPTYSAFTGRILVHGSSRKWAPWNITANCCNLIERPDGTSQVFLGNGVANGKIYELVDAAIQGSDDGVVVNDFYRTPGNPSKNEEEALQLRQHRKICEYLTGVVTGNGLLSIQAISPYRTTPVRAVTLSPTLSPDFERKVSIHGERIFWQVGTNAVGNWFQLERLIPCLKPDPTIPVRGLSA